MPSKKPRINLTLPPELQTMVEQQAEFEDRPVASQVMRILKAWAVQRKREVEHFKLSEPQAGQNGAVDFDNPNPPASGRVSNLRGRLKGGSDV